MDALILFNSFNYPVLSEYNGYFLDLIAKIAIKHNLISFAGSGEVASDSGISNQSTRVPGFIITTPNGRKVVEDDSSSRCGSFEESFSNDSPTCSRFGVRRLLLNDRELFNSIIQLILAPYVASLRVYKDQCFMTNLLFDSVKTLRINFKEYLDHMILHISDSSTIHLKNVHRSQRKIDYFTEILKFTFGSNLSAARIDDRQSALAVSLYRTWISMQNSPVYLSEATERLLVSPSLRSTFSMIQQSVLGLSRDFLKKFGEIPVQSLLYENGRLLADVSSQPCGRLSRKDSILVQLIVDSVVCRRRNVASSNCKSHESEAAFTNSNRYSSHTVDEDLSFLASPLCRRYARFNSYASPPENSTNESLDGEDIADDNVEGDDEQSYFGDTEDAFVDDGMASSFSSAKSPKRANNAHDQLTTASVNITSNDRVVASTIESRARNSVHITASSPSLHSPSNDSNGNCHPRENDTPPSKRHRHHRHFSSVQLEVADLMFNSYCCNNSQSHSPFVLDQSRINSQHCNAFLFFLEPLTRSSVGLPPTTLPSNCSCTSLRLPYCLRIFKVTSSLTLVTVSELSTRFLARSIHVILDTFSKLLYSNQDNYGSVSHQMVEFDRACSHLHRIFEKSPKYKLLAYRLVNLVKSGQVRKYFNKNVDLPLQLDALSSSLSSNLRDLYHEMVYSFEQVRISKVSHLDQVRMHHASCQALIRERASLYLEYISVKSLINMRLDPYASLIPGLKGFVYVDRKLNSVIHALASEPKMKDVMISGMTLAHNDLMKGKLVSETFKDNFSICYLMWFEDDQGNSLKPLTSNFTLKRYPCLMSDFIDQVIEKCFTFKHVSETSTPPMSSSSFDSSQKKRDIPLNNIYAYELLVIVKRDRKKTLDINQPEIHMDPIKFHRLANKLSEFFTPDNVPLCYC